MPMDTFQLDTFHASSSSTSYQYPTLGYVVDTNDPTENGRFRAVVPQWGDTYDTPVDDLPWITYTSPVIGTTSSGSRGPGIQETTGEVAYGFWSVPKVGATVVVMCLDGDPQHRVYISSVPTALSMSTMPHGRYMYDDHPALEKRGGTSLPAGPYSATENTINPLYDNIKKAFGNTNGTNFEWQSRGADYTATSVPVEMLDYSRSKVADDESVTSGNWNSTQGYSTSRTDPNASTAETAKNKDSTVTSIVSPGFHALSMDDRIENCRMRLRTTAGHQILMDDTNERIYISTAEGNNWIEMDQAGNICMYTSSRASLYAADDINFTSGKSIRFMANDINLKATNAINIDANTHNVTLTNLQIKSDAIAIQSTGSLDISGGSSCNLTAANNVNILASGDVLMTGSMVHMNGPAAQSAASASPKPAAVPSMIPAHEPWARSVSKSDTDPSPEFPYDSASVGRSEQGVTINRGLFWRR